MFDDHNENNSGTTGSGHGEDESAYRPYTEHFGDAGNTGNAGSADSTGSTGSSGTTDGADADPYGGNVQYKWNYDDYQKALKAQQAGVPADGSTGGGSSGGGPGDGGTGGDSGHGPKKPRRMRRGRVALTIVCVVVAVGVLSLAGYGASSLFRDGGLFKSITASSENGGSLTLTDKPASGVTSTSTVSGTAMTAAQVVAKVKNSVVAVETYDLRSVDPSAEGSGIIMSADGYVITNEHVIDGASKIEVIVNESNGSTKSYDAKLIGKDTRTDLAVLKISATGLTAATFGNSSQVQVGEAVLAVGNPGGVEFSGSVTSGIISATNRSISENGYTQTLLQTDAPINPGNSGGALVNMYGQVVGITSSKIEETGFEGMGFAIPINSAQPIINSIIKNGYVTGRIKLGISVAPFTSYQAKYYNMPTGLYVASVDSTSDAAKQGVKTGDIITKINGQTFTSGDSSTWYNNFYKVESQYKAGDTVTLTVSRYDQTTQSAKEMTFKVKLAEDKGDTSTSSDDTTSQSNGNYGNYGNNNDSGDDSDGSNNYSFFGTTP